jgi:iron complex transport system substrate-binding protein
VALSLLLVIACHSNFYRSAGEFRAQSSVAECRLVKHELGESCVPLKPQRVIVTDQLALEIALALDVKPIAAPEPAFVANQANFLGSKMAGIIYIGKEKQLNIEKIIHLHPDLIIGVDALTPETYKLFSQIAPTVELEYFPGKKWKDTLRHVGGILNKSAHVEELLTQYNKKIQKIRYLLGDKIEQINISISRFHGEVQLPEFRSQYSFPGSILAEIGLSMPVAQKQLVKSPEDTLIILSLERINLLDADILFVAVDPNAKELFKKYQNSKLWKTLEVVQNQQVYTVDSSYWIFGNILSANAILDDLLKYIPQVV